VPLGKLGREWWPQGIEMKIFVDCFRHKIRLTDERLAHILEHSEMQGMEDELERVLQQPAVVHRSHSDKTVWQFYGFYAQTTVGSKWLRFSKIRRR
jgi:hypothetical protein